jgi:hypothetical protein
VTTHVLSAELPRPDALDTAAWGAVQDPFARLKAAVGTGDRPLIVGSAKELVEATARVVLEARGRPAGSAEDYEKVLAEAHRAIEHQIGPGVAADAAIRQAATLARKLAGVLRELRNAYGTGHGRAALRCVEDEVLETCVDGALLWTRWALRRLQLLLLGSLQPLIADLRGSTFGKGDLATRLAAADLPRLGPDDQRQLGVAVGQRAARNTFTVRIDGVEACAASQDEVAWPPGYREGVVEGLFLDQFGQIRVDEHAFGPRLAAEILVPHPGQARVVADLAAKIRRSAWSPEFRSIWRRVVVEIQMIAGILADPAARLAWIAIAEHLRQTGEEYESALV